MRICLQTALIIQIKNHLFNFVQHDQSTHKIYQPVNFYNCEQCLTFKISLLQHPMSHMSKDRKKNCIKLCLKITKYNSKHNLFMHVSKTNQISAFNINAIQFNKIDLNPVSIDTETRMVNC